jgi:glycosyltransferase involved in cell wall biosynthesis
MTPVETPPDTTMTEVSRSSGSASTAQVRRRLRICHLAYTFYETDNRVIRYAQTFADCRNDVDVIALRRPDQSRHAESDGVGVFRIQRRTINEKSTHAYLLKLLWFFIKSTMLLTLLQVRRRYDVVHVHNVPDFLVFAALVPKLMGARIILDIHDILPELYAGKFGAVEDSRIFRSLLAVERHSCRFADHVIVANHLWYDKLVRRSIAREKCTTIMNYPDLTLFRPLPAYHKRRDGKFIILYPGTLNQHQGVDIAIKAFALVSDAMPNAEFHIYGEGPARPSLERLTRELGLGNRIKLRDRVPLSEISQLMALADVGVVPKRAEGFGNEAFSTKVLEFMACGVPVVVSRTQVDAHYFDDKLVRFFESGQDADLGAALLWIYEHRSEHEAWIRHAREFAVRYGWQTRAVDYYALIESLLRTSSRLQPVAGSTQ